MGVSTDCQNFITLVWTVSTRKGGMCTNSAVVIFMVIPVYLLATLEP